jgi:hypothetical protein
VKEHRNAVELSSTLGQLLGIGAAARAYTVPDWFFITVGSYLWAQPPVVLAPRAVLHVDASIGVGGYIFFSPDAPLRVGMSAGTGGILSFLSTPGMPAYTDLYVDVISWWVEAHLFGATLFVRQDFKYALGAGTNLLGAGWMTKPFPPTTLGIVFQ